MHTTKILHTYTRLFYTLGFTTALLRSVFIMPLFISTLLLLLFLVLGIFFKVFLAMSIGIILALFGIITLVTTSTKLIATTKVPVLLILFSSIKVFFIATIIACCYIFFAMPILALLFGMALPLFIVVSIQLYSYVSHKTMYEEV